MDVLKGVREGKMGDSEREAMRVFGEVLEEVIGRKEEGAEGG